MEQKYLNTWWLLYMSLQLTVLNYSEGEGLGGSVVFICLLQILR